MHGRQLTNVPTISPRYFFLFTPSNTDIFLEWHVDASDPVVGLVIALHICQKLTLYFLQCLDLFKKINTTLVKNTKWCFDKSPMHLPDPPQGQKHPHVTQKKCLCLMEKINPNVWGILQVHWWVVCQALGYDSFTEVLEFTDCRQLLRKSSWKIAHTLPGNLSNWALIAPGIQLLKDSFWDSSWWSCSSSPWLAPWYSSRVSYMEV